MLLSLMSFLFLFFSFFFISPPFQSLSHQHTAAPEALHSAEALQPHHLATMSASTTASQSHKAVVGGDSGAAVPHRAWHCRYGLGCSSLITLRVLTTV
jgi:hypothetical protein